MAKVDVLIIWEITVIIASLVVIISMFDFLQLKNVFMYKSKKKVDIN